MKCDALKGGVYRQIVSLKKGKYGKVLKGRQGLAVGFVDGDLTLL